jgi:hypothetical protein
MLQLLWLDSADAEEGSTLQRGPQLQLLRGSRDSSQQHETRHRRQHVDELLPCACG